MVGSGPNLEESMGSQHQEGIEELVCIPPILAGTNLGAGATFLMMRILDHAIGD